MATFFGLITKTTGHIQDSKGHSSNTDAFGSTYSLRLNIFTLLVSSLELQLYIFQHIFHFVLLLNYFAMTEVLSLRQYFVLGCVSFYYQF